MHLRRNKWGELLGLAITLSLCSCAPSVPRTLNTGRVVASAAVVSAFKPISVQAQSGRTLVLLYHDIRPRDKDSTIYDCTKEEFERQMTVLYQEGANVITVSDLYQHLTEGTPLPERPVVITFDDNYASVKKYGAPILDRFRFPYSVYVHTDYVGNEQIGREKMTWGDLKQLMSSRYSKVEIGSHSASHPWRLDTCTYPMIRREVRASKEAIERNLETECFAIAWPGGHYSLDAIDVAIRSGYRLAFGMGTGFAEQSPSIMEVCRYPFYKFQAGWEALKSEGRSGVKFAELPLVSYPIVQTQAVAGGVPINMIEGGRPRVATSKAGQTLPVLKSESKAAAVAWLGSSLGVPFKPHGSATMTPGNGTFRSQLVRPLVLIDPQSIAFLPYSESQMNEEAVLRRYMPELTDIFLGECWLVNKGDAMLNDGIAKSGCTDPNVIRPRAFLGVKRDGACVIGLPNRGVTARKLADIAASIGCVEAVMLPSTYPGVLGPSHKVGAQISQAQLYLSITGEDATLSTRPEEPAP